WLHSYENSSAVLVRPSRSRGSSGHRSSSRRRGSRRQEKVNAARPYAEEITNVMSDLASNAAAEHPVLQPRENPTRAGIIVVSSDRGLCGAYNANVLRRAEELQSQLVTEGKEPRLYVIGRSGVS